MRGIVDGDKAVIIGTHPVVDPGIGRRDLMEWIIGAFGQLRIVSVNRSDPKNSSRRATVAFFFPQTGFALTSQASAPRNTVFSKQYWKRSGHAFPIAAPISLE